MAFKEIEAPSELPLQAKLKNTIDNRLGKMNKDEWEKISDKAKSGTRVDIGNNISMVYNTKGGNFEFSQKIGNEEIKI
jgi:hypothetical protein